MDKRGNLVMVSAAMHLTSTLYILVYIWCIGYIVHLSIHENIHQDRIYLHLNHFPSTCLHKTWKSFKQCFMFCIGCWLLRFPFQTSASHICMLPNVCHRLRCLIDKCMRHLATYWQFCLQVLLYADEGNDPWVPGGLQHYPVLCHPLPAAPLVISKGVVNQPVTRVVPLISSPLIFFPLLYWITNCSTKTVNE